MKDFRQLQARKKVLKIATIIMLSIWGITVLFPFYWMILTSVKDYGSYNAERIPAFIPTHPTLQNYADAFTSVPLGRYFLNTVIFSAV